MSLFETNLSEIRYVVFDTETTGISPHSDEIVEIAAKVFDEDFEHRQFQTLICPLNPIPKEVIAIHGITNEMVENAPHCNEAMLQFFEFLNLSGNPRVLIAHNAGFDVSFIHSNAKSIHEKFQTEIVLDSCMLAKALLPELKTHRLESLAQHFKIETGTLHRATEDVRVLKSVFMSLLSIAADRISAQNKVCNVESIIDLMGGYFELAPWDSNLRKKSFRLSPRLQKLEALCGQNEKISIAYETDENVRYITPISITIKGFRIFLKALCHRDDIEKTFRVDKIKALKF